MITEQYVTFETAKMLKKAGFDIPCERLFLKDGCPGITAEKENHNDVTCNAYSRPTQQLAARWLREVHDITVDVFFNPPKEEKPWNFFVGNIEDMFWAGDFIPSDKRYGTYEEALEEGLRKALLIIKNKDNEQRNNKETIR